MSNFTFLLLVWAGGYQDQVWAVDDLELFQKIGIDQTAADSEGVFFVAHGPDHNVLIYNADGERVGEIGRKGEGPGEFVRPSKIMLVGNDLVVADSNRIQVFNKDDGRFIKAFPHQFHFLKTAYGWLAASHPFQLNKDQISLLSYDASFGGKVEVLNWTLSAHSRKIPAVMKGDAITLYLNPARDRLLMATDLAGQKAFIRPPGSNMVHMIDCQSRKIEKMIKIPTAQLPFSEAWGERVVEKTRDRVSSGPRKVTVKPHFPEHFPAARLMMRGPGGFIYLTLWSANPDKQEPVYAYNSQGEQTRPAFGPTELRRIIGLHGDLAMVITWDEEKGAGIVKMPKTDVSAFVKSHPIEPYLLNL